MSQLWWWLFGLATGLVVAVVVSVRAKRQRDAERLSFSRAEALLETEVKLRAHAQKELSRIHEMSLEGTRVKAAFLANMSHELRTPMNAVVGLTDLLLRENLTARQRESLETVRDSSNGLLILLDDLLDLSKIEAGAMRLDRVEFSVREVMSQLERLLAPKARLKGLIVGFNAADDVPQTLLGDPHRLTQVLTNLVGNSIKFTDEGEVQLSVRWRAGMLEIEVRDTGIGMTEEQCAMLFQPFTQVDASVTRRFGGTGLGLAIVRRLCELHRGDVTVSSILGLGSVFIAKMAFEHVPDSVARAPRKTPIKSVQPVDGLRVLIAEDNRVNQLVAERMLERLGATYLVVNNGAEAIEALARTSWDVILMDVQMPVMDGLEATRQIRAQHTAQPKIIVLTANAMNEDRQSALEAGVDDFLAKPITLDALSEALHRTLGPRGGDAESPSA